MNILTRTIPRLTRPTQSLLSTPRTFTTLTPLRPLLPQTLAFRPQTTTFTPTAGADLVPKEAITSSPTFGSVRFGPRNTMNGATRLVQKRRHGFLARMRSRTGRKIIQRRRIKGRRQLAQ